ncbi:unnamed protein product, partial [Pleuronectes platessa]
ESEDTTQRDELREEPLTLPQESDEDDSQREEERAEPLTVPQENNEGGSQRQEQRAESFTMVQPTLTIPHYHIPPPPDLGRGAVRPNLLPPHSERERKSATTICAPGL